LLNLAQALTGIVELTSAPMSLSTQMITMSLGVCSAWSNCGIWQAENMLKGIESLVGHYEVRSHNNKRG
jgi:hypothetical protein